MLRRVTSRKDRATRRPYTGSPTPKGDGLGDLRWWWILSVGTGVGVVSCLLLIPVLIIYFLILSLLDQDIKVSITEFATAYGSVGMPILHMLLTAFAASWVARRVGIAAVTHGVLTALVSVAVVQGIWLSISPLFRPAEAVAYLVMGLVGGLLGGVEGRGVLEEQEALYRASQRVGGAPDPRTVLASVHDYLAGSAVIGVALLGTPTGPEKASSDGSGSPGASLIPWCAHCWPDGVGFDGADLSALASPGGASSSTLRPGRLSAPERAAWRRKGVRSVLLIPLVSPAGRSIGVLAVALRTRRPPRSTVRACLTFGAQVALALENLRLVEEAREAGVLRERQRMAREIHDTLAQGFTSIVMNLEAAEGAAPSNPARAQHHLEQARLTAREGLTEARRLVWALRPESLEEASLPEALGRLAERWSGESGIAAAATTTGTPRPLPLKVETTLFRVAQEALSNVRKHARGASRVALTLSYMGDAVALDVRDDGAGFDPARELDGKRNRGSGGLGLKGASERVEGAGGSLSIESAVGEGSTLAVELPAVPSEPPQEEPGSAPQRRIEPPVRGVGGRQP